MSIFHWHNSSHDEQLRGRSKFRRSDPWKFETQWDGKTRDKIAARWRALTKRRRHVMQVPNILGECGWWIDSALVNADVVDYQERINLIDNGGLIDRLSDKRPRILEIGGGYGALCSALTSIFSPSQYVICDLPESLLFSGLYLSLAQVPAVATLCGGRRSGPARRRRDLPFAELSRPIRACRCELRSRRQHAFDERDVSAPGCDLWRDDLKGDRQKWIFLRTEFRSSPSWANRLQGLLVAVFPKIRTSSKIVEETRSRANDNLVELT